MLLDLISIDMLEVASSYCDVVDEAEAVGEGFWVFKELIIRVASQVMIMSTYLVLPNTPA
jgi:hypothetical protein